MTGKRILDQLRGRWTLDREIAGEGATLIGEAMFEPTADGDLAYREEGVLKLPNGQSLHASRRYLYRSVEGGVAIEFSDAPDAGKTFVNLHFDEEAPGISKAQDIHLCGADTYRVRYELSFPDAFTIEIDVQGPNKAYRAISRFARKP